MAGGLKGGHSLPMGQLVLEEKSETSRGRKGAAGLSALYASTEVLTRRINFQPAKSGDAHSLISTKLTPLNDPFQLPPSQAETGRGSASKEQAVLGRAGSQSGSFSFGNGSSRVTEAARSSGGDMDILLTWKGVRGIGAGLSNMGNTCFLNSVLQCLTYTPPLVHFLETGRHHASCRQGGFCALCELRKHVLKALGTPHGVVGPTALVRGLRTIARSFRIGRQEDAHEYTRHLLEALHKACLPPEVARSPAAAAKASSFVQRCFGGKLRSQVQCAVCSFCSNTDDPFLDLSLDVHRADSIPKALQRFTAAEVLDGDNKYRCSRCKKKVRAHKRLSVAQAPPVLTVQLKRFSAGTGGKIDKWVRYGASLDLRPFVSQEQQQQQQQKEEEDGGSLLYSLYAVLVHAGRSTHSGHYFCFVRTAADTWHLMDDSRVRQVSEKTVLEQRAYMLFYIRKAPPPRPQLPPAATGETPAGTPANQKPYPGAPATGAQAQPVTNGKAEEGLGADRRAAVANEKPGPSSLDTPGVSSAGKGKAAAMNGEMPGRGATKAGATAGSVKGEPGKRTAPTANGKEEAGGATGQARAAASANGSVPAPERRADGGRVAGDEVGVRVERGGGAEKEEEGEEEDGTALLAEGEEDMEEGEREREDVAGRSALEDGGMGRGDSGAEANEAGTSGRRREGGAGSGEAWEESYRQKAGTAWPRTTRSLMRLLLTMPKTRRYFWALGSKGLGFLRKVRRRFLVANGLRGLGGQELPELAGVVVPGRRMTRGLAAQLLGKEEEEEEEEEEPGTPKDLEQVKGQKGNDEVGSGDEASAKGRRGVGAKVKRRREGKANAEGVEKRARVAMEEEEEEEEVVLEGKRREAVAAVEGGEEAASMAGKRAEKEGPRVIHFHGSETEEGEVSLKGWTVAGAEESSGRRPPGGDGEGESSEEGGEEDEVDERPGEEGQLGPEKRGSSGQQRAVQPGATSGSSSGQGGMGGGGGAVRGAAAIKALAPPAAAMAGLFEFDVPQWDDAPAGPRVGRLFGKPAGGEGIKRRRYDAWDAELDKGRVKKVKSKTGDLDLNNGDEGPRNLFQETVALRKDGSGGKASQEKTARRKAVKNRRLEKQRN